MMVEVSLIQTDGQQAGSGREGMKKGILAALIGVGAGAVLFGAYYGALHYGVRIRPDFMLVGAAALAFASTVAVFALVSMDRPVAFGGRARLLLTEQPAVAYVFPFNSPDMVREMTQCFVDDVENVLPQMRVAIERGDLVEVGRLGHRLKGTISHLGAEPATLAARRVEHFLRHGGRQEDAEEAVQDAFVRAYRSLARCDGPDRFGPWLFGILVNRCRTRYGQTARRSRVVVHDDAALADAEAPDDAEGMAWRDAVSRAVARLDPEWREAFLLKHVEDLSYDEMAALTGVGVSALKMRVSRACERLRTILEEVERV